MLLVAMVVSCHPMMMIMMMTKMRGTWHRTLDPFNEPNTNYWWAGNNQEVCSMKPL